MMKVLLLCVMASVVVMLGSIAVGQDGTLIGLEDTVYLDGYLDDWPTDPGIVTYPVAVLGAYDAPDNAADFTMTWKGYYNPTTNRIYLAIERTDDIKIDRAAVPGDWFHDYLEVYVDGNNDEASPAGTQFQQYAFCPPLATPTVSPATVDGWIYSPDGPPDHFELLGTGWAIAEDGTNSTYEISLQILDEYPTGTTGTPTPDPVEINLVEGITIGLDFTSPDRDETVGSPYTGSSFMMWGADGGKSWNPLSLAKVALGALVTPPPRAITIDGNVLEWLPEDQIDVSPAPTENIEGGLVYNDIEDIFVTNDDDRLYVRFQFDEPWGVIGWGTVFIVNIDADNDPLTGSIVYTVMGSDYKIEYGTLDGGGFYSGLYTFNGVDELPEESNELWGSPGYPVYAAWSGDGTQVEVGITRAHIGAVNEGDVIGLTLATIASGAPGGWAAQDWAPSNPESEYYEYTMTAYVPPAPPDITAARGEWVLYE